MSGAGEGGHDDVNARGKIALLIGVERQIERGRIGGVVGVVRLGRLGRRRCLVSRGWGASGVGSRRGCCV